MQTHEVSKVTHLSSNGTKTPQTAGLGNVGIWPNWVVNHSTTIMVKMLATPRSPLTS
ncbi:Uncharacterized protein TCM_038390 [Theobroma cacao]|uniref:Uncharacterized protein n=1 Tax=Theobroma cacao TaxID=3641 RepID=A0A061GWF3_THECC|nr:Uncharacterized protein TCM_038390 [Theobroma cacao]